MKRNLLVVTFASLLTFAQADAALIMSIDSLYTAKSPDAIAVDQAPAGTATVIGNSTVADDSPGVGFIQESSTTADAFPFLYTVSGQQTTTPSGLAVFGTFENLLAAIVTIEIWITATDIVSNGNVLVGELTSTILGTGGSITGTGFIDPLNKQFGISGSVLESVMLTAPVAVGLVSSLTSDLFAPTTAPFSLTNRVSLTLGPSGRANVNFFVYTDAVQVPEPATFGLLTVGLLALAFGNRKARTSILG